MAGVSINPKPAQCQNLWDGTRQRSQFSPAEKINCSQFIQSRCQTPVFFRDALWSLTFFEAPINAQHYQDLDGSAANLLVNSYKNNKFRKLDDIFHPPLKQLPQKYQQFFNHAQEENYRNFGRGVFLLLIMRGLHGKLLPSKTCVNNSEQKKRRFLGP